MRQSLEEEAKSGLVKDVQTGQEATWKRNKEADGACGEARVIGGARWAPERERAAQRRRLGPWHNVEGRWGRRPCV